jgi:hypothetical protein
MTTGGEIYLAVILTAFLIYVVTLFWAMVTSGGGPVTVAVEEHHRTAR